MKRVLASFLVASLFIVSGASAQSKQAGSSAFPGGKTVTIIVPYSAGGLSDILARFLAPKLEAKFGSSFIIVNKPGAGAQIGLTELVRSKPDGYTLVFTNFPTVIVAYLDKDRKAIFDRSSFQPIVGLTQTPLVVAVHSSSPYHSLKDLVAAAKSSTKPMVVSTGGVLSNDHLAILDLEKASGVKFGVVHFDGAGEAVTALVGKKTQAFFGGAGSIMPQVSGGNARIIAVFSKERADTIPDIPTAVSQGYPVFQGGLIGISAPAKTPRFVVDTLSDAIEEITKTEDFKEKLLSIGSPVLFLDPEGLADYWKESEVILGPLVEEAKKSQ